MNKRILLSLACLISMLIPMYPLADYGSQQLAYNVSVKRLYVGGGATYVTFTPFLPGCTNPGGGYIKYSLASANGGVVDDKKTD